MGFCFDISPLHPHSVCVNLGLPGLITYSSDKQNPLLRFFAVVANIFCLFQGHIENITPLKQQYGLTKTANEVSIIIEAYHTLRDRGPHPANHVVRDINGKFAFLLYDSSSRSTFIAADTVEVLSLSFGESDAEHHLVLSDDEVLRRAVGNLLHHFLKGVSLHPLVA